MVHLVYCVDKAMVLEKILNGSKTMVVRGASGRKIRNMDDWLIINKMEDVVVGTSIPFNYENSRF